MDVKWPKGIAISPTPLRKVIHRSSAITNGWHRTNKHPSGVIAGESRGELIFLMFAEMCPHVVAVAPQPCEIPFNLDGKAATHFPDFAVMERHGAGIFEVKSARQYHQPDVLKRLRAAARSVEARNWPYHVSLRDEIEADPRYDAVEDLWRRHRRIYDDLQRLAVEAAVSRGERVVADVVSELASSMGDKSPSLQQVLSLAANAKVFITLDTPIGEASVIRAADPAALPEPLLSRRRPADDLPWEFAA